VEITAQYLGGDRLELVARGHRLVVDQPVPDGGEDQGMTPTELFVAGLAGCVGFYAERFLHRHGLDPAGLHVTASWAMSTDRPARVATISMRLEGLGDLPDNRRAALQAVVEHCSVHNSLRQPPEIVIELGDHQLADRPARQLTPDQARRNA
jgi:uncharacterized OsmC-like protein